MTSNICITNETLTHLAVSKGTDIYIYVSKTTEWLIECFELVFEFLP